MFREQHGIKCNAAAGKSDHRILGGSGGGTSTGKIPQTPLTTVERVKSAAKAAKDYIANGGKLLDESQIAERLAICQTCDQFENNACKLCGCGCTRKATFTNKLAHPLQECPHKPPKWGKCEVTG